MGWRRRAFGASGGVRRGLYEDDRRAFVELVRPATPAARAQGLDRGARGAPLALGPRRLGLLEGVEAGRDDLGRARAKTLLDRALCDVCAARVFVHAVVEVHLQAEAIRQDLDSCLLDAVNSLRGPVEQAVDGATGAPVALSPRLPTHHAPARRRAADVTELNGPPHVPTAPAAPIGLVGRLLAVSNGVHHAPRLGAGDIASAEVVVTRPVGPLVCP